MPPKQSKSQKRLAKKIEKQIKESEKNARFAQDIHIENKPIRLEKTPDFQKNVRISELETNYKDYCMAWCKSKADKAGSWSWGESREWTDHEENNIINPHLNSNCNNTWRQIELQTYNGRDGKRKPSNKAIPLDSICGEAQSRWMEDEARSQFDELFRFRIGTDRRIWGVRCHSHFFMIWYERNHQICPVNHD